MTLLRYNVEKPWSSYAQVRLIAKKKDEKLKQIDFVIYKPKKINYLPDLMNFVYDEVVDSKHI